MLPSIFAALATWGLFGIEIPVMILCIIVGVCGLVGGVINLLGRGPVWAGALIGLLMALGGYGAVSWWSAVLTLAVFSGCCLYGGVLILSRSNLGRLFTY